MKLFCFGCVDVECCYGFVLSCKAARMEPVTSRLYPKSLEVHVRVDRLEARRCFRRGVH